MGGDVTGILCYGLKFSEVTLWFQRWGLHSAGLNGSESSPELEREWPPAKRRWGQKVMWV